MSYLKIPVSNAVKSRRVPNAFMLFVQEQKKQLVPKCPDESKSVLGAFLGRKWRSMASEEKQVYFDKYKALKELEIDNSDLSSIKRKIIENENDMKSVMNEISTDSNCSVGALNADQGISKSIHKRQIDASFPTDRAFGNKKYKADLMSSSVVNIPLDSFCKQKSYKKIRRPPNAYMLFAREQRYNIDPSYMKDKKCHTSTILGNMWKDLPVTKRQKYYEEAQRLFSLQKKSDAVSSSIENKTTKKKTNKTNKKTAKRSVGRPKKEKELLSAVSVSNLNNQETSGYDKKTETETDSSKTVEIEENIENINASSEPHVPSNYHNGSYLHQHNSLVSSHYHHMPPPIEPPHSKFCHCQRMPSTNYNNGDTSMKQYPIPNGGLSRSCFGGGLSPPFFSPYHFNNFWMYHQAMAHQMYFPQSGFPPSYCNCSLPYHGYPNSYFSSYVSGRCSGSFYNPPHACNAATATSSNNMEESMDEPKNEDNSDDELLVVDEGPDGEQRPQNGIGPNE